MTIKYLNQAKLTATVTPTNSAIAAGDSGQTALEKLQGQFNTISPTTTEPVYNGLENPALFAVSYSASDRKFTVTASTGAAYTVSGVRYALTAGAVTTAAHSTDAGIYYLYYTTGGALTVSNALWDFYTTAQLALAYYNPSNNGGAAGGVLCNELHPGVTGMSNATHQNLHNTRGTQLYSGCVASGYTLNTGGASNINWTTTQGSIADEDIYMTVTTQALGGANNYRVLYLTGTTAAPVWNWTDSANYGILGDGTNIYYNQNNAGTWQQTAIAANSRWVNYWIMATTSYSAPQIVVVMGQKIYTSATTASSASFSSDIANFGLFTKEAVVLYRVTYERASGAGAPENAKINAFTQIVQSLIAAGVGGAPAASDVSVNTGAFVNFFGITDSNVQQCLDDLDSRIVTAATANAIVKRDGSGDITAHAVTSTTEVGAASVTDPTTSSAGALNTALSNINSKIPATVAYTDYGGTSTIVGFSTIATKKIYYQKIGTRVFVDVYIEGESNATGLTFTVPYAYGGAGSPNFIVGGSLVVDNGIHPANPGFITIDPSSNIVVCYLAQSYTTLWTASGTKYIAFSFSYYAAA